MKKKKFFHACFIVDRSQELGASWMVGRLPLFFFLPLGVWQSLLTLFHPFINSRPFAVQIYTERPSKPQAKINPANNTEKLAVNQGAVAPNHPLFFHRSLSNHNDRTHKYDCAKINSLSFYHYIAYMYLFRHIGRETRVRSLYRLTLGSSL